MAEFVIALADLFEAEARAVRFSIARLVGAIALILGAAVLALAGFALWLWSLYLFATRYLPPDAAALATGLVTFLAAGIMVWIAKRLNH
jgi:hypothetical protein